MLTSIRLQNFRSYLDDSFELSESVNIIVGKNASGKTNLLESILINAGENSYRGKDIELINHNSDWAKIDCNNEDNTVRTVKLQTVNSNIVRTYEIDGNQYKRLNLAKTIPVVVFEPNNLNILTTSPDSRRNFLDELLEKIKPGFKEKRRQYKRVLYQRNALLKTGIRNAQNNLFVWNLRLSELGDYIFNNRMELINTINQFAEEIYNELSITKSTVSFEYVTKLNKNNYASDLIKSLERNINTDIERGFTSSGPHRDDFDLILNNHMASETASRGEMRTLMLVCKILETRVIEKSRSIKPILLLDDVFSELDGGRRQALTNFLKEYQTFITTTDADVVLHHFSDQANIIAISKTN
jgi:DNA replication and repair protein RecF